MKSSIWEAIAQDGARGKHALADTPAKYRWPEGSKGPTRARLVSLVTHTAALTLAGTATLADADTPAQAAAAAIAHHGLKFREHRHYADCLARVAAEAQTLVDEWVEAQNLARLDRERVRPKVSARQTPPPAAAPPPGIAERKAARAVVHAWAQAQTRAY